MAASSSSAAVVPVKAEVAKVEVPKLDPIGYDSSDVESGERSSDIDDEDLDVFLMGGEQKKKKRAKGDDAKAKAAPKKKRRKKTMATATAAGVSQKAKDLLGKANLAFTNGDYSTAAENLLLVIQEAPGLAEPFHTLGIIYEEWGNMKKSEEFFLLAVHLTPNDAELWRRVAGVAKSRGDLAQAAYCLRRCLRNCADEENMYESFWKFSNLFFPFCYISAMASARAFWPWRSYACRP